MSKLFIALILVVFYLPQAFAKSPVGNWTTVDDKTGKERAIVHLKEEDGILSGTIVRVFSQPGDQEICKDCPGKFKDKPIVGLKFLWGLKDKGMGVWTDGQILDAKTGKIYRVKMTMKGNKLFVRAYMGLSVLGRTQVWVR